MLKKGYNKKIPPTVHNLTRLTQVPVRVSLHILKILDIEEVKHKIQIQFKMAMKWYERRAIFNNLKGTSGMNVLSRQEIESLWLPLVTYANTDKKETTRLGKPSEWNTHVKVKRESNFTRGGLHLVDEVEVFEGSQNYLRMMQIYTKTFQCQYAFHRYPFDTQTCTIKMDVSTDDLRVIKLLPYKLEMRETLDLTLFKIKSWRFEEFEGDDEKDRGVVMKMDLQRKVMNELLTTFLPSILLMIITFATTSFKPFFFEAALSVNLTTMLMMTTISIGKMQTLPATAYVRMIDVWLVFCQLVPFAEVILLTAQEYYRDGEEPAGEGAGKNKEESEGLVHVVV